MLGLINDYNWVKTINYFNRIPLTVTCRFYRLRNLNEAYVLKCRLYFLDSNSYIYLLLYVYSFLKLVLVNNPELK